MDFATLWKPVVDEDYLFLIKRKGYLFPSHLNDKFDFDWNI